MMLDVHFSGLKRNYSSYLPVGLILGFILLMELLLVALSWPIIKIVVSPVANIDNTSAIGNILYTDYLLPFQIAGLILLTAMIGAIVLTFRTRPGVRRQKIAVQIGHGSEVVSLKKVETGKGV